MSRYCFCHRAGATETSYSRHSLSQQADSPLNSQALEGEALASQLINKFREKSQGTLAQPLPKASESGKNSFPTTQGPSQGTGPGRFLRAQQPERPVSSAFPKRGLWLATDSVFLLSPRPASQGRQSVDGHLLILARATDLKFWWEFFWGVRGRKSGVMVLCR